MVLALRPSVASTAGQRSNPDILVIRWQRLPGRVWRGAVENTRRGFALKPPIAVEADRPVFVRVDPGTRLTRACIPGEWRTGSSGRRCTSTAVEFQAVAIALENRAFQRAETVWLHWASTAGPKARTADPSLEREYRRIKRAVPTGDTAMLNSYGGVTAAPKRAVEMQPAVEVRSFQVVIDGERTWQ